MKCDCGTNMDLEYSSNFCKIRWCPQCGRLATVFLQEHFQIIWTPLVQKLTDAIQKSGSHNTALESDQRRPVVLV